MQLRLRDINLFSFEILGDILNGKENGLTTIFKVGQRKELNMFKVINRVEAENNLTKLMKMELSG